MLRAIVVLSAGMFAVMHPVATVIIVVTGAACLNSRER